MKRRKNPRARTGILLATNRSGVPGVRPNVRKGYQVIDVTWHRADGSRTGTSYLIQGRPLQAVQRALARRQQETGLQLDISPRQAWAGMWHLLPAGGR